MWVSYWFRGENGSGQRLIQGLITISLQHKHGSANGIAITDFLQKVWVSIPPTTVFLDQRREVNLRIWDVLRQT
jgi:hypothetical protein